MISKTDMKTKMGDHPIVMYQYRQIHNLVDSLRKQHVVFHSLRNLELWILEINAQKKLLPKLYNQFPID